MEIVALIVEYILQNYARLFDVYAEIFFFLKNVQYICCFEPLITQSD